MKAPKVEMESYKGSLKQSPQKEKEMSRATIIEQLLAKGIEMEKIKNFEGIVRYYRNNEHRSDYHFTKIVDIQKRGDWYVVLVKSYTNQQSQTVYSSDLFIAKKGEIAYKHAQVCVNTKWWKEPDIKWEIGTVTESNAAFVIEGQSFGKQVLEKGKLSFLRCPLSDDLESFFKGGD
jgi:hypothetical protein